MGLRRIFVFDWDCLIRRSPLDHSHRDSCSFVQQGTCILFATNSLEDHVDMQLFRIPRIGLVFNFILYLFTLTLAERVRTRRVTKAA